MKNFELTNKWNCTEDNYLATRNGENDKLSLLEPPLDVFLQKNPLQEYTLLVCQKTPIYMQVSGFMRENVVQTSMLIVLSFSAC